MLQSLTPEYMKLSQVVNVILSVPVASDFEEHLDEEDVPTPDSPKKLVYPSQDIKNAPETWEGVPFMRKLSGIHLVLYILQILVLRLKLSILEESLTINALW